MKGSFALSGVQSDVARIERLVLKHARDAFIDDETIGGTWRALDYLDRPDFAQAVEEYDRFISLLESFDIDIDYLPRDEGVGLDSIYPRDAAIISGEGAILCNLSKLGRRAEPAAIESAFSALGIPIHGAISGSGRLEGGDVAWIDERTLAVGRSRRTNQEGIRQLWERLGDCIDELIEVPLPDYRGPGDVFHLMSIFSPIDDDLALVYSPLVPATFREALLSRGIKLVEVPDPEFDAMACNALAIAPRRCVVLSGNPLTRARLEQAGAEVHEYEGAMISRKGAGGPTCLTLPIVRG